MGNRQEVLFVLGSPFTGSTFFGNVLNTSPEVMAIGEAERFRPFKTYENLPQHYLDRCFVCDTHDPYDCPIWTDELQHYCASSSLSGGYEKLLRKCRSRLVVDGSKNVEWMRRVLQDGAAVNPFAVVIARSPLAFAQSNRTRVQGQTVTWHVEGWRNIYLHIFRSLASLTVPFMVVRLEDFLHRLAEVAGLILGRCGLDPTKVKLEATHTAISHPLGGNLREISRLHSFRFANEGRQRAVREGWASRHPEEFWQETLENSTNKSREIVVRRPVNPRARLTDEEVSAAMNSYGVLDTAALLGYTPTYILQSYRDSLAEARPDGGEPKT